MQSSVKECASKMHVLYSIHCWIH